MKKMIMLMMGIKIKVMMRIQNPRKNLLKNIIIKEREFYVMSYANSSNNNEDDEEKEKIKIIIMK